MATTLGGMIVSVELVSHPVLEIRNDPPRLVFYALDGSEVGTLMTMPDGVSYTGNADEGARLFFHALQALFTPSPATKEG